MIIFPVSPPPGLRLKSNTVYLVAGVVIQDGKVLLIQECKISFKNKWYLPAGRMERDESIVVSKQVHNAFSVIN